MARYLSEQAGAERQAVERPDFFVSYTQADRGWAEWIAWQLEAAGYSTILQAWDFGPGSDWAHEMQRATTLARRTVAVLSSAYLESAYAEAEWQAAFANDPRGTRGLLVPVRVQDVQPPGLLRTRVYVDLVGLSPQAARQRLLEGIGTAARAKPAQEPPFPGSAPGRSAMAGQQPRFPGLAPEITNLPARNRNFIGRGELFELIQEGLPALPGAAATGARVVHGLGGVGKTQLVLEYAHWHAAEYEVVWWVRAERTSTAVASLAALARRLGVLERADQGEMLAELFDSLRRRDRWLLIYDDAEGPEQLAPLLPPGGGHVLITSRYPAWGRVAQPILLEVLHRRESVAFLRRRTGSEDEASAAALAELLGDLPLALEEAAAYLEQTQLDLAEYLRLAGERTVELFGLDGPIGDEQRVATAWSVSLERVRAQAPAAEALLDLCAYLAPDGIPRELARSAPDRLPLTLAGAARDPLAFNDAVRTLGRYSLATVTPAALGVHLLVQMVVRARLGRDGERRWCEAAVGLLCESFPERSWEVAAWPACQRLLPHVLAAAEHAERLAVAGEEAGWLLDRASAYLRGRGQPRLARPAAERALAVTVAALGPDDPAVGERHNALGRALRDLGDLGGARAHLERALAIAEATLGREHADVAVLRGTLAQVLRDLGDLGGARAQLEQALGTFEATLGPDRPEVGGVRNEIAHLLWARWDLVGARVQLERALAIYEASYGPGHPRVATVRSNLGSVLQDLGDPAGARAELERALAIYEAAYGPDHPEVATVRGKLGSLLMDLGDLPGARTELERALGVYEATMGPQHPNVAVVRGILERVVGELSGTVEPQRRPPGPAAQP